MKTKDRIKVDDKARAVLALVSVKNKQAAMRLLKSFEREAIRAAHNTDWRDRYEH